MCILPLTTTDALRRDMQRRGSGLIAVMWTDRVHRHEVVAGGTGFDVEGTLLSVVRTPHAIDLLRWFGGEIVAVCSQMAHPRIKEANPDEHPCWTSMALSMRYETDAVASLLASWDSDFTHPIERLEICGSDARLWLIMSSVVLP